MSKSRENDRVFDMSKCITDLDEDLVLLKVYQISRE